MKKLPNLLISTIILSLSNIFVRCLGFLYKIFMSNAIGELGLGIYHIVFNFLMICIALTTTGIPTALSCLIASTKALKNKYRTNVFFISTLYVSFFISFSISIFVYINSNLLAKILLNDESVNIFILGICPAIVLITISNVLRGYFYGIKRVSVPAIGQAIEQISRMLFLILVFSYIKNKLALCYYALIAISIGEAVNILFITINLYSDSEIYNKTTLKISDFKKASLETVKMSLPITCNKMTNVILQSFSSLIIPSRLALSGMSHTQAMGCYGIISGMVLPFIYLPFSIGSALVVNLIPSISQEVTLKNNRTLLKKIYFAIILTLVIGGFCSLFYYLFAIPLCEIVFKNKTAGLYLKSMCLAPIFLSLNQTLSSILHGIRKEFISSFNSILGMAIQIFLIYMLLPIKNLNIYAYIYVIVGVSIFTSLLHSISLIIALKKSYKL